MSKEENVIQFYVLTNKLKDLIRSGWEIWKVKKERLESVAEHIFGVQMLAIAMHSEYDYKIDLKKVLYMLAVHELEEIYIGDLTLFEISSEEKKRISHEAVNKVLENLLNKDEIDNLIKEFDERKTKEAQFAYQCDKLECDLQCKLYDEDNYVNLNEQKDNNIMNNLKVKSLLKKDKSWSKMWLEFGQMTHNYDENFLAISNFAINNEIKNSFKNKGEK